MTWALRLNKEKLLKIPEMVPFRLTRDMIDPMGALGMEGTFRRCCEETLNVLREDASILMTIIEVLKHDPLYTWTLDPVKAKLMQKVASTPPENCKLGSTTMLDSESSPKRSNDNAIRALHVVRQKLFGMEQGNILSVKGQVAHLLQTATNVEVLGKMYSGWQAFL